MCTVQSSHYSPQTHALRSGVPTFRGGRQKFQRSSQVSHPGPIAAGRLGRRDARADRTGLAAGPRYSRIASGRSPRPIPSPSSTAASHRSLNKAGARRPPTRARPAIYGHRPEKVRRLTETRRPCAVTLRGGARLIGRQTPPVESRASGRPRRVRDEARSEVGGAQ